MVVPDVESVELVLTPTARGPGVQLTWPAPDDESSTCVALIDTLDLGIPLVLAGAYADDFDRTLQFSFKASGDVGTDASNRFVCSWINANAELTGRIEGEVNLSNTGGLWVRNDSGAWSQRNGGLPVYLPFTNLVDLVAADDGELLAVLSRSQSTENKKIQNNPQGIYRALPGGDWAEVASEQFGRSRRLSTVAVRPSDADFFAVGTQVGGLFVTNDGGATFAQWTGNLDPDFEAIPDSMNVTALTWSSNRILVAVWNYGTFVSVDNGENFTRFENLEAPDGSVPEVNTFAEDAARDARILVGTELFGVYESIDAGTNWQALDGNYPNGIAPAVLAIETDPSDADQIVIGTSSQGIWSTTDGGDNWLQSTTPFDGEEVIPQVWDIVLHDGILLAMVDQYGLNQSADGGRIWTDVDLQPFNRLGRRLVSTAAGLLRPTNGGGVFTPNTSVSISSTQVPSRTDEGYVGREFGLTLSFGDGSVILEEVDGEPEERFFRVICQDYQGWAVWRSERGNPDNMAMIGRYDKTNPETCIVGYCGDESISLLPNCFAERRAACFLTDDEGSVGFYDGDVHNGFTYLYSVTPFDFGDISMVTDPVSLASPMVFPKRYPDDDFGVGDGAGNRQSFAVDTSASDPLDGDEIYVFPNPLRRGSGFAGSEGEEVIWTNLPPDSRVDVFTLAGDVIANLPQDDRPQEGGNIYWITRNDDDQLLASGIYMWRVVMPERGDFWGKLAIIR